MKLCQETNSNTHTHTHTHRHRETDTYAQRQRQTHIHKASQILTYGSLRNVHSCNPFVIKFIIAPGRQSFDAIALLVYCVQKSPITNTHTHTHTHTQYRRIWTKKNIQKEICSMSKQLSKIKKGQHIQED